MNEIIIDLSSYKTADNILKTKVFTVSVAEVKNLVACDCVEIVFANKGHGKMEKAGLQLLKVNL